MKHRNQKPSQFEDQQVVAVTGRPEAWAELLSAQLVRDGRPAGDGWKTIREIAAEIDRSPVTVDARVRKWVDAGLVEEAWGTVGHNRQRTRFVRPKRAA